MSFFVFHLIIYYPKVPLANFMKPKELENGYSVKNLILLVSCPNSSRMKSLWSLCCTK